MIRTFVAIDLPTELLHALATTQTQVQEFLRAQELNRALRWSPTQNLHLTLRFLGDTSAQQQEEVATRLHQVAAHAAPFVLQVDVSGRGLGGFPTLRQPRVLWTGVDGDVDELRHVQGEVEAVAQGAGFAPESKSYSPHLTLARAARDADRRTLARVGQAIGDFVSLAPRAEVVSFAVDRVIFYQSELGPGGSRYTSLAEARLAGG